MKLKTIADIQHRVVQCRRCPELREYCHEVGREKRKAYADWDYWAKPVPGFGDHRARIMIVGLAPGAHGANRTGRMFTGDRSGDFLYAALHRAGLANQATATHRDDGLQLTNAFITAPCRCAPPANRPTAEQLNSCRPYLVGELAIMQPQVVVCLGQIAWTSTLRAAAVLDVPIPKPRPKFAHGAQLELGPYTVLGCYHVSQQNTFTGRLTESMIDDVLAEAVRIADG